MLVVLLVQLTLQFQLNILTLIKLVLTLVISLPANKVRFTVPMFGGWDGFDPRKNQLEQSNPQVRIHFLVTLIQPLRF